MVGPSQYLRSRDPADKPPARVVWRAFVDSNTAQWRYAQCLQCPRLTARFFCRECGCFMPAKTKLAAFDCPLGKWPAESNYHEE